MRGIFPKIILAFILLVLLALGARAYYFAALNRPSASGEPQTITINPRIGVNEIADLLYKNNLINSKVLFKLYLALNNLQATLEAGEYEVPPYLNLKETVALLQHGTFDLKLTFPEGWRREEAATYAAGMVTEKLEMTERFEEEFREEFLEESEGMEGYLFPETYFVLRETTAGELVEMMRAEFSKKFTEELKEKAKKRGLTEEETVILASIVERETKFDEDRVKVAGVLIKRLRNGWLLEADATVQFAIATERNSKLNPPRADKNSKLDYWPRKLTTADLEVDSPYNTRKYKGLPPGPISSPGLKAIEAVVGYEESPYWFYVSDKEGRIHFSKTLDEHNEKVLKYTQG